MVGFVGLMPRSWVLKRRRGTILGFDRLEPRQLLAAGTAPTDLEQYMLELINRARANPAAEGQRLLSLTQTDPILHQATAGWDLAKFDQVISSYAPSAPLAFDPRLIDAALAETNAMLAQNSQTHSPAGFLNNPEVATDTDGQAYFDTAQSSWATGENIFAYSQTVAVTSPTAYADFFEAGFLLDWGNPNFGHLRNILAPSPSQANPAAGVYPYSVVGIGLITNVTPTISAAVNVGPALVTQEFGWRQGNAYLTGTLFQDQLNTGLYAPGEGYGGVIITARGTASEGTFQTQTWASGGYSLQLPPGTYEVTASRSTFGNRSTTVAIGLDNVGWSMAANPSSSPTNPVATVSPAPAAVVPATSTSSASTSAVTTTAVTATTPTVLVTASVPTMTSTAQTSSQKSHKVVKHKPTPKHKVAHLALSSSAKKA